MLHGVHAEARAAPAALLVDSCGVCTRFLRPPCIPAAQVSLCTRVVMRLSVVLMSRHSPDRNMPCTCRGGGLCPPRRARPRRGWAAARRASRAAPARACCAAAGTAPCRRRTPARAGSSAPSGALRMQYISSLGAQGASRSQQRREGESWQQQAKLCLCLTRSRVVDCIVLTASGSCVTQSERCQTDRSVCRQNDYVQLIADRTEGG